MNDTSTAPVPAAQTAPTDMPVPPLPKRRSPRPFILGAIAIGVVGYGIYWGHDWWTHGRFVISTDDAYVGAKMTIVWRSSPPDSVWMVCAAIAWLKAL